MVSNLKTEKFRVRDLNGMVLRTLVSVIGDFIWKVYLENEQISRDYLLWIILHPAYVPVQQHRMMMSWHRNAFRISGLPYMTTF